MSNRQPPIIEVLGAREGWHAFDFPPSATAVDVLPIVEAVAAQGAQAVLDFTARFDRVTLTPQELVWDPRSVPFPDPDPDLKAAIDEAFAAIAHFHRASLPETISVARQDEAGGRLEERFVPLERVGLYVPRGRFPLISSLMMTGVPAMVAGVDEITVALGAVPPSRLEPEWGYLLQRLGVRRVISAGGAQAVAAMAFGLPDLLPAVDLIAGPGNAWVTAAKAEVARRGLTAIDLLAGPSEVTILAGPDAPVEWAVADALAQAEHAPDATGMVVSWDRPWLEAALAAITPWLTDSLGPLRFFLAPDPETAVGFANWLAPEHLGLMGQQAEALLGEVRTAGAVFVGPYASEAYGDYVAGPSHVLPTGGSGRFSSGLSTRTFMRRLSVIHGERPLDARVIQAGATLARYEGLTHHARALSLRADRLLRKD